MSGAEPDQVRSKYAWREVPRTDLRKRSAAERVADFLEIYGVYDEETAREQASRCIQCPEPTCVHGCPLSNRIPEWLALTAEGHFLEAASLLHSTSSLPEICARVCPADRMCEGMCVLNGKAEPVSIWAIEQFLNEYAFNHGAAESARATPNGFRVGVIGSGPGGLTCADVLSRRGYAVTVYDWRMVPGGLLVSGSPAFRLDRSVVGRRLDLLRDRGVEFMMGVRLGEDLALETLRQKFDALFLGIGARKARELTVPGHESSGVVQALTFLIQSPSESGDPPSQIVVAGRRVLVLGGGDMAMDCLRAAIRAGASEATCVYRRAEQDLPCNQHEYVNAVEEGARFVFQASPVAVIDNGRREAIGVRFCRTELGAPEPGGRRAFAPRPGTEFELGGDLVIVALGFEPLPPTADDAFGMIERGPDGRIQVDANQMTRTPGIFAGGELVRGPSQILDVVRDARRAAEGIHHFLQPKTH